MSDNNVMGRIVTGTDIPDELFEHGMSCVVVGGCANGLLLKKIRADAEQIELRRPDYIKPLSNSGQQRPEVAHESDIYDVHPLGIREDESQPGMKVIGIAVLNGATLEWALNELILGFVADAYQTLLNEGHVIPPQAH